MARAYYNEFEPYCAQWLRNLIDADLIPPGDVDDRSIEDVRADDLRGYTQCHFFAGLGGWGCALRLAGWPDDRPIWTGSPPCQPFSAAGKGKGFADRRDLWPHFHGLIDAVRPPVIMGEQVDRAVKYGWLDRAVTDLAAGGYACGAIIVPACGVNAPHKRDRLWFVADSESSRDKTRLSGEGHQSSGTPGRLRYVADAGGTGLERRQLLPECAGEFAAGQGGMGNTNSNGREPGCEATASARYRDTAESTGFWDESEWLECGDGKQRRVKPGLQLLAYGVSARVAKLRALGNAIVPQVAAEVIKAYMEAA